MATNAQIASVTNASFSTIINNQLVKNETGENTTPIKEDLSNIITIGKAIADLTIDDLKDSMNKFIVGISKNYYDNRPLANRTLGLMKSAQEYAGAIQRIKMGLGEVKDGTIYSLDSSKTYDEGLKWADPNTSNRVYNDSKGYQVIYKIPLTMFKQSFTSIDGVMGLVGLIEGNAQRTSDNAQYLLEKATLVATMVNSKTNEVKLATIYKNLTGTDYTSTPEKALLDTNFMKFASEVSHEMIDYVKAPNKKYNDGTISTYVPTEDIRLTLLSKFAKNFEFTVLTDLLKGENGKLPTFNTVDSWIGVGDDMFPSFADVSTIISDNFDGTQTDITINNVVGCIYDTDSCGITEKGNDVTSDWNGQGGFTTYYMNKLNMRYSDPRNTMVLLTLN